MAIIDNDFIAWRDEQRERFPQFFNDLSASRVHMAFREEVALAAFRAGKEAGRKRALSHAAGQDGEQCRAASVEDSAVNAVLTTIRRERDAWLSWNHDHPEQAAITTPDVLKMAANLIRALSRGVPEGMDRLRPRNWTREMDVAWHTNIPDTVKAFDALIAAAIAAQQPILGVTGGTDEGWGS